MTSTARFAAAALVLALAACGDDRESTAAGKMGEVLPGSASDAMLPLDTVRSQPPLDPGTVASDKDGAVTKERPKAAAKGPARKQAEPARESPAEETPAPTPTAEPAP